MGFTLTGELVGGLLQFGSPVGRKVGRWVVVVDGFDQRLDGVGEQQAALRVRNPEGGESRWLQGDRRSKEQTNLPVFAGTK